MFIQATNVKGEQILINTDAITYVELNADVGGFYDEDPKPGVKIYFQSKACHDFIGEVADRMREGLPKLLEAHSFD